MLARYYIAIIIVASTLGLAGALIFAFIMTRANDRTDQDRAISTLRTVDAIDQWLTENVEAYYNIDKPERVFSDTHTTFINSMLRMDFPSQKDDVVTNHDSTHEWDRNRVVALFSKEYPSKLSKQFKRVSETVVSEETRQKFGSEICDHVAEIGIWRSIVSEGYADRASMFWTREHESAECLYLILNNSSTNHQLLQNATIGDVDGDNMFEILDGWGKPIQFSMIEIKPNEAFTVNAKHFPFLIPLVYAELSDRRILPSSVKDSSK